MIAEELKKIRKQLGEWKSGRAPLGVAQRAAAMNIPTIVLAGDHDIALADLQRHGIIGCYSICRDLNVSAERSIAQASVLLVDLAANAISRFAVASRRSSS